MRRAGRTSDGEQHATHNNIVPHRTCLTTITRRFMMFYLSNYSNNNALTIGVQYSCNAMYSTSGAL